MSERTIYVTEPSLPDLKDFIPYLEKIWDSKRLTNNGPFHEKLEEELCKFLGVKYCSLFCNGTIALHTAVQALQLKGEVITSPFTFPATTHAIHWNRCTPVFCDIDPATYLIDLDKVKLMAIRVGKEAKIFHNIGIFLKSLWQGIDGQS